MSHKLQKTLSLGLWVRCDLHSNLTILEAIMGSDFFVAAYRKDTFEKKVDLGIGAYR